MTFRAALKKHALGMFICIIIGMCTHVVSDRSISAAQFMQGWKKKIAFVPRNFSKRNFACETTLAFMRNSLHIVKGL